MRALLRRRPPRGSAPLRVGDLSLNADTHEVARGERAIDLTQREFELLEYLMRNERIVISRQRLLDEVWGYDPFSTTNTIEVFVSNLRRKLEADGEPRLLHTIRGAGYVLRALRATGRPRARRRPARRGRSSPSPRRAPLGGLRPAPHPHPPGRRLGAAHLRDPLRLRADRRLAHRAPHPLGLQPRSRRLRGRPRGPAADRREQRNSARATLVVHPNLDEYAAPDHAAIRFSPAPDRDRAHRQRPRTRRTARARTSPVSPVGRTSMATASNPREAAAASAGTVVIQYARPLSDVQATIARVELLLVLGTLAGTGLALLAGAMIARRAMQPDRDAHHHRRRDRPHPRLQRQPCPSPRPTTRSPSSPAPCRGCCARSTTPTPKPRRCSSASAASSPTPPTSCAPRSPPCSPTSSCWPNPCAAIRATPRARRCAPPGACAGSSPTCCCSPAPTSAASYPAEPVDLAQIALDAAAELGPLSGEHELSIDAGPAIVQGDHDELLRLTLNLIENALRHTPPGTAIRVSTPAPRGAGRPARRRRRRPRRVPRAGPHPVRALRPRRRRSRRLVRPGARDRPCRRRLPRRLGHA